MPTFINSTRLAVACICASAMIAGCSETQVYHPRPTSASLMIEVIGPEGGKRWVESRRIEYRYPEDELLTLGGNTEGEE